MDENPVMPWRVVYSREFRPSVAEISRKYNIPEDTLFRTVAIFQNFKIAHDAASYPSSADKKSGYGASGSTIRCQEYVSLNIRHCHMDMASKGDPLIVYKQDDTTRTILVIGLSDHVEMHINHAKYRLRNKQIFAATKKTRKRRR